MLRYYFKIENPDALSDVEFAGLLKELAWIRKEEAKANGLQ